jgi:predicted nucleic acid-binding protein
VALTFDNLPPGAAVFLDANCLVCAFGGQSPHTPACRQLLDQIENGDFQGVASSQVLGEMAHRLMPLEAASSLGRSLTGMANWLKRHPAEVQRLSRFRQAIDEVGLIGIRLLPVEGGDVSLAADITIQHGLLSNDVLVVVLMRRYGLTHLVSLDTDLDRVPGITRYAPV